MKLTIMSILIVCLRVVTISAVGVAFAISVIGDWLASQISFIPGSPEYISGGIAVLVMIAVIGLRWNSSPVSRNLTLAAVGTFFHVPGALQGSGANWLNVVPSLNATSTQEPVFVLTFIVVIVTCVLGLIIDSAREEVSDLMKRGLVEESVRAIVKQAVLFKVGTLLLGLLIMFVISFIPIGPPGSLPPAVLAFVGVLVIIIPVVVYFDTWPSRNISEKES